MAFDRRTAEQSRHFTQKDEVLSQYFQVYEAHMQVASFKLPDGTIWGAPRVTWHDEPPDMAPAPSRQGLPNDERVRAYHAFVTAIAAHSWPTLAPLAQALRNTWWDQWNDERAGGTPDMGDPTQRNGLATYLARFVQGIPFSVPTATRLDLRPPVSTLIYRLGDCDSKSLLLALLLKHCRVEAGLFISFDEGHAMCAASLPDGVIVTPPSTSEHFRDEQGKFTTEENAAKPAPEVHHHDKAAAIQIQSAVAKWRRDRKLDDAIPLWAAQPQDPSLPVSQELYVPIESTAPWDPGRSAATQLDSWVFLPLSAIWMRFETERSILRTDSSETESLLS